MNFNLHKALISFGAFALFFAFFFAFFFFANLVSILTFLLCHI